MPTTALELNGQWEFREYPRHARRMRDLHGDGWMPAKVPSSIYTSLVDAGRIDKTDLYTNPENYRDISDKPWIYKKTFDVTDNLLASDRIDLIFDGLDTATQIWLNDKLVAKTENMFIAHRFDVTKLIKPKGNTLLVKFSPAAEHATQLMKRYGRLSNIHGSPERAYIRKAQYQFGWDFCPPLPGCGIWRQVRLEGIGKARIEDIHIRTVDCTQQHADIKVDLKVDSIARTPFVCSMAISDGQNSITHTFGIHPHHDRQSTVIRIDNPKLWNPAGYGEQNMYKLSIQLASDDQVIDSAQKQFAIRTVKLNREKDKTGSDFQFEINNRPVYIKGASWIPASMFPGNVTEQQYKDLLTKAASANINMLRVWGGGYYEDKIFYDTCDTLGIMVWQEFMFAEAYYPDRTFFTDQIKQEAEAVIKQLRSHPSLVIWCGNSNIDHDHATGKYGKGKKFYGKNIYHKILPSIINELDPDIDYIPGTPFGTVKNINDPYDGTFHQQLWEQNAPTRDLICLPDHTPRFVAQFGFQSAPSIETIKTFCHGNRLKPASQTFQKHNYQLDGNERIARYASELFPPAADISEHCYTTQLTQARAAKKYIEHLRANNRTNRGVMIWNYNDPWPASSASCIDQLAYEKAICFYAKRFFAPVIVTPIGIDQQFDNAAPLPLTPNAVVIVNDSTKAVTGSLSCILYDFNGNIIDSIVAPVATGSCGVSGAFKLPRAIAKPQEPQECFLHLRLENDDQIFAENLLTYLPDKFVNLPKPHLNRRVTAISDTQFELKINSEKFVRDLQVLCDPICKAADNFIDILPNRQYRLILESCKPVGPKQLKVKFRSVGRAFY